MSDVKPGDPIATVDEAAMIQALRDGKKARFANVEVEIHDGLIKQVNYTEKRRPGASIREVGGGR